MPIYGNMWRCLSDKVSQANGCHTGNGFWHALSLKLCPDITPEGVSHSSILFSMNAVPSEAVLLPQFSPPSQWVGQGNRTGRKKRSKQLCGV